MTSGAYQTYFYVLYYSIYYGRQVYRWRRKKTVKTVETVKEKGNVVTDLHHCV